MAGARRRMARDEDLAAWSAWHTAALGRTEKFPEFKKFARRGEAPPEARAAELLAKAAQWDARIKRDNRSGAI